MTKKKCHSVGNKNIHDIPLTAQYDAMRKFVKVFDQISDLGDGAHGSCVLLFLALNLTQ